jgi:hypothetical protein
MISCECSTYGRVEFLEEQLYSFLNQDYSGEKEMVITNDYPLQKLVFDHPDVRIINLDKTFDILGDKKNFAVEQCKGDILVAYDDDDLSLPNHLSNIEKYFIPGSDLLHWERALYMNIPNITAITSVGNSGIVFSRKIWRYLQGYPRQNAGFDMTFVNNIKAHSKNIVYARPPDEEVSWIYVWGGRGYHCSGQGDDKPNTPNIIQRHSSYIEEQRKKGLIPTGTIVLQPNWKRDYTQMLKDFINK